MRFVRKLDGDLKHGCCVWIIMVVVVMVFMVLIMIMVMIMDSVR